MEFVRAAKSFGFGSQRKLRDNDFFSDRLSHRHTTKMLIIFVLLATFKRLFHSPINCWVPAELRRYERYINKYCWIKGTYYVNQHYDLNSFSVESRNESLLHYYQWVYFFLLIQALLFYVPRIIWCFVSSKILDFDLFNMVDAAMKHEYATSDPTKIVKYLGANITNEHSWMPAEKYELANYVRKLIRGSTSADNRSNYNLEFPSLSMIFKKLANSTLTLAYIAVKLLYLANALFQLFLMNMFLSNKTHSFYGWQVLMTILRGEADLGEASDSKIFPRITICDVKTTEIGTDHTYTVQCVLSFNLFNERIYAFLWFWIFMIIVPFTVIDILNWTKRFFFFGGYYRFNFLLDHIRAQNPDLTEKDKFLVKVFSEYYMGNNGVFVLRLLEHNANAIVVTELINFMWMKFKTEHI